MFERLSARRLLLTCEFTFACAGDVRLQSSWSHGGCLHLTICVSTRRRPREQAAGCLFGVAWQLVPPVTHAPTSHLNWEVQIMGTRWNLVDIRRTHDGHNDGHTMDTVKTQHFVRGREQVIAEPNKCLRGAYVSSCFCSVHRVSIVVSIVRPPRVHRCVRRCLVSSWP